MTVIITTVGQIIRLIENDLPGWTWIVRSDKDKGYFANLLSPDHESFISWGKDVSRGKSFPHYASTPEGALILAYNAAKLHALVGGRMQ